MHPTLFPKRSTSTPRFPDWGIGAFGGVFVSLLVAGSCMGCSGRNGHTIHTGVAYSLIEHLDDAEIGPSPIGRVEAGIARIAGAERSAILFQFPGWARFAAVPIHRDARLTFGLGITEDPACAQPKRVVFSVAVQRQREAKTTLWSTSIGPRHAWQHVEIPLAAYSGQTLDVLIASDFSASHDVCRVAWTRPVIHAAGSLVDPSKVPIHDTTLVHDLLGATAPPIDLGSFVGYGRLLQAPPTSAPEGKDHATPANSTMTFSLDVPADAELELAGEILKGPKARTAPGDVIQFDARIDGDIVLHREVQVAAAPLTFVHTLQLDNLAGRSATLELSTRGTAPGTLAWWTTAWLLRHGEVRRQTGRDGPNVLLVVVDTLRADRLGLYGAQRETTPNLDRLAKAGRVFDAAISSCSWTQPSVATLLTGLSPMQHGVVGGVALRPEIETLAEALRRKGLTTLGLSSNPIVGRREGFHRGFETFVQIPWARADQVNEAFLDWLQGHRDARWFAYLHYIDPHDSYDAPPPIGTMFLSGRASEPSSVPWEILHRTNLTKRGSSVTTAELDHLRDLYDGEIRYWDSALGDLLTAVGPEVIDNTVLVVVGDHGEEFMDHGKLFHGFHLFDESIRVPLVIRAPHLLSSGRDSRVFELSGLKKLVSQLASGAVISSVPSGGTAFSHTAMAPGEAHYGSVVSIRDADWKYILDLDTGQAQLYDFHRDPAETTNRAMDEPTIRSLYDRRVRAWVASGGPAQTAWRDPDLVRRLRALGYVE